MEQYNNINNIIKLTNILLKAQDMCLCFKTLRPDMIIVKSIDQHSYVTIAI